MNQLRKAKKMTSSSKERKGKYKYRQGTVTVTVNPRKLASEQEMALCAMLVKFVTVKEASRLMGCSVPTLSRAVRAHYYSVNGG